MSRDEEADQPQGEGGPATAGEPAPSRHTDPTGETPEPVRHFAVVISENGSAAIDGETLPADADDIDTAILDALHRHAREAGGPVTASISDPAAGYVAHVEVTPDGASRLLEQHGGPGEPEGERAEASTAAATAAAEAGAGAGAGGGAEGAEGEHRPTAPYGLRKADFDERDNEGHEDDEPGEHDEYAEDDQDDEYAEVTEDPTDQGDEALDGPDTPADPEAHGADPVSYRLPEPQGTPGPRPARVTPTPATSLAALSPSSPAPGRVSKAERRNRPRQSDDEYEGPGLLNRPLVVGPAALIVAALVVIPLVVLGSGGSDDGGHQSKAAKATTEPVPSPPAESFPAPTVSVSADTAPPSPSPSPSPSRSEAKPKPGPHPEPAPATTVTVTAEPPRVTTTVTAKPKPATAATEVNRLAQNDPGGRHICYRAYVEGQGWQKPVCDGTLAGTTGKGKSIKALNISVHGTGGSAANAVLHNPDSTSGNGSWQPSWTAITQDGKDFYVGNPKKDGPYMTGFAINIGSGQICRTAAIRDGGWGARECVGKRPAFVFGGTMRNDVGLEAVKFTV